MAPLGGLQNGSLAILDNITGLLSVTSQPGVTSQDSGSGYISQSTGSSVGILLLIYEEIKLMLENPFNGNRMHPLRDPWRGYYGWYPNKDSKIRDYRIIYKIHKKVLIFRIGHHSIVYKK